MLLLLAFVLTPQTPPAPPTRTNGNINGRMWRSLDVTLKTVFLMGLEEGLREAGSNSTTADTYFPKRLTHGEFMESIDQFYAEPANLLVPVIRAMPLITGKVNGAQQSTFDKILALLRAEALAAPENKK